MIVSFVYFSIKGKQSKYFFARILILISSGIMTLDLDCLGKSLIKGNFLFITNES